MNKVTIPKREYDKLLEVKMRYEYLKRAFSARDDLFASPPTKDPAAIIDAFKKTGRYGKRFIASLEKGLKRSAPAGCLKNSKSRSVFSGTIRFIPV